MPVEISTSVTRIGGRGIDWLVRLERAANDPRIVAAAAAQVLRRRVLPELRSKMPVKSGALKASLSIQQSGSSIYLGGVDYRFFVLWRLRGAAYIKVPELLGAILRRDSRRIAQEIAAIIFNAVR